MRCLIVSGPTFVVLCLSWFTVQELKLTVEEKTGVPHDAFRLVHKGTRLRVGDRLRDYNLEPDSTLDMRPYAAAPSPRADTPSDDIEVKIDLKGLGIVRLWFNKAHDTVKNVKDTVAQGFSEDVGKTTLRISGEFRELADGEYISDCGFYDGMLLKWTSERVSPKIACVTT